MYSVSIVFWYGNLVYLFYYNRTIYLFSFELIDSIAGHSLVWKVNFQKENIKIWLLLEIKFIENPNLLPVEMIQ